MNISEVIREKGGISVIVGGEKEHIHLLGSVGKTIALSDAVRDIKTGSTNWIHRTFPSLRLFAWQEGYAAFTVGVTGLDRVKEYILQQKEHHRKVTFQEEFVEFLRRHNVRYDERYLW